MTRKNKIFFSTFSRQLAGVPIVTGNGYFSMCSDHARSILPSIALLGEQPVVIFFLGDYHSPGTMTFVGVNLELRFLAAGFLDGGNHAFRSFWWNGCIQRADKGVNGNRGQIRGPLVKIGRHIFRPFPPDAADDRGDGRKVLRIMRGPRPRAITTHADARKINPPVIHRQRRLQMLEQEIEVLGAAASSPPFFFFLAGNALAQASLSSWDIAAFSSLSSLPSLLVSYYRGVLELLAVSPNLRAALGMQDKLPHYTTLQKFSGPVSLPGFYCLSTAPDVFWAIWEIKLPMVPSLAFSPSH